MKTMRLTLPEELDSFVDAEATAKGFASGDAYVLALIEREQQRQRLRTQLLDGLASPVAGAADDRYFDQLMEKATGKDTMR